MTTILNESDRRLVSRFRSYVPRMPADERTEVEKALDERQVPRDSVPLGGEVNLIEEHAPLNNAAVRSLLSGNGTTLRESESCEAIGRDGMKNSGHKVVSASSIITILKSAASDAEKLTKIDSLVGGVIPVVESVSEQYEADRIQELARNRGGVGAILRGQLC